MNFPRGASKAEKLGLASEACVIRRGSDDKTKLRSAVVIDKRATSPKAGHLVKVPPTRATRKVCQERLACKGPRRDATHDCLQCGSLQCEACETLIHENPRFVFHDRQRLCPPIKDHLCQHTCETRNLADIHCLQCRKQLCFACDTILHHSKGKFHQRTPFEADVFYSLTNGEDPELAIAFDTEELHSLLGNKPLSIVDDESIFPDEIFSSLRSQPPSGFSNPPSLLSDPRCDLLDQPKNRTSQKPPSDSVPKTKTRTVRDSSLLSVYNSFEPVPDSMMMSMQTLPDVTSFGNESRPSLASKDELGASKSFLLIDDKEELKVTSVDEFVRLLHCAADTSVKVLSIYGNTGEGKSHTLNHTFFGGRETFHTSTTQVSCTIGVWTCYDPRLGLIVIDTEGLLGLTTNQNQRTRLLLKVLAISDVIIYRTRAERLHNDLFTFLGDASKAYSHHFSKELKAASKRFNFEGPLSTLGPAAIIFHETLHTEILTPNKKQTPEDNLKARFKELDLSIDAFSALQYIGTQTFSHSPTIFKGLAEAVEKHLSNSSIRSARTVSVVYQALQVLNRKFSGDIECAIANTFPDEYFTCGAKCLSCDSRCTHSMNHGQDGVSHSSPTQCKYQHQFENQIYLCTKCHTTEGRNVVVVPKTSASNESSWFGIAKYAWAGYVLECSKCGVIYRSRQYWYGNKDPLQTVVRTEICHVWAGEAGCSQSNQNAARRVIDGVGYLTEAVSNIGAKPTKSLTSWVTDQLAPSYWVPNYSIKECHVCQTQFGVLDQKHHCRACGEGVCGECSLQTKPVPEKGWGMTPVRVCNDCFNQDGKEGQEEAVTVRKVTEVLHSAIGSVASAIDYPLELIKDTARPSYWIPDEDIKVCVACKCPFNAKILIHHCRACGQGVCNPCSQNRRPVPSRGWDHPVRVCSNCHKKSEL